MQDVIKIGEVALRVVQLKIINGEIVQKSPRGNKRYIELQASPQQENLVNLEYFD